MCVCVCVGAGGGERWWGDANCLVSLCLLRYSSRCNIPIHFMVSGVILITFTLFAQVGQQIYQNV